MALSYSEFLDNLYTTTWNNMKDTAVNNIFKGTPFWFWLREKGKLKTQVGGRDIGEPLVYDKNTNVKGIGRGGVVSLNDYEFLTTAKFQWRYTVAPIVRFGVDDQQNRGKAQIMSLMNSKLENNNNSLIDYLETRLASGSGAATDDIDGLQLLIADDPTAAGTTIGGIDQGTYTWWRNKTTNMNASSFAVNGVSEMRTMANNVTNGRATDRSDLILTSQTVFEWYEDTVLQHLRTYDTKLGEVGFDNLKFKGIPMVWAPSISQRMYFINTRYMAFTYDPNSFFDMTEWKTIPDQVNDKAAQVLTAGNLVISKRDAQGVIYNINTA